MPRKGIVMYSKFQRVIVRYHYLLTQVVGDRTNISSSAKICVIRADFNTELIWSITNRDEKKSFVRTWFWHISLLRNCKHQMQRKVQNNKITIFNLAGS